MTKKEISGGICPKCSNFAVSSESSEIHPIRAGKLTIISDEVKKCITV